MAPGHEECPDSSCPEAWCQTDGWSCGFHAARYAEMRRRQLRGEAPAPVPAIQTYRHHANDLVVKLQKLQAEFKGTAGAPLPSAGPSGAHQKPEGNEKPPSDDAEKPVEPEAGPDGTAPQVKKPESQGEKPRGVKRTLSYTPAGPKSIDWETAQARALTCPSCVPRRSGPYAGQKGCSKCMGQWFEIMRTRAAPKAKLSRSHEASGAVPSIEAAPTSV